MKKFVFLLLSFLTLTTSAQKPYSVQMALSQGNSHWKEGWDPASGMLAHALLEVACQYPEETALYDQAKSYLDKVLNDDGTPKEFQKGVLENMLPGKALLDLCKKEENKDVYKKGADWLHSYLVRSYPRIKKNTGKTAFIHDDSFPNQMWLQDLYDGCSFYAQWLAQNDLNNKAAWTDIAVQLLIYEKQAFNTIWGLAYPHWSVDPGKEHSFWANREGVYSGASNVFTAQSSGYLLAALIDVLEYLPKNQAGIKQLKSFMAQVAEGVLNWQDETSGCWYQIINHDANLSSSCGVSNYLESTGSSLLAYSLLKGVRLGLLDKEKYGPAAQKAYEGIIRLSQENDGVLSLTNCSGYIGVGNGSDMARDGSLDYYLCGEGVEKRENDAKAVSAFILACLEYEKMN